MGIAEAQNTQNILMKNMLDTAINSIAFYLVGFGLAFGEGELANGFIGSGAFALVGMKFMHAWFVQFTFANNAATIAAGELAMHMRDEASMCSFAFNVIPRCWDRDRCACESVV